MRHSDRSVRESVSDGHGNFHIPGAHRLAAVLDDAMKAMLAPLSLLASDSKKPAALYAEYRQRWERLVKARHTIVDDTISGEAIACMSTGRPASGDGFGRRAPRLRRARASGEDATTLR
jgi:hypothetical protein